MDYWVAVLEEVRHKDDEDYPFIFTNLGEDRRRRKELMKRRDHGSAGPATRRAYYLGEKYKGVYLTRREAECMVCMLRGKTIIESAQALSLSPRTVEFYVKNVKVKLKCRRKSELLARIKDSDFDASSL